MDELRAAARLALAGRSGRFETRKLGAKLWLTTRKPDKGLEVVEAERGGRAKP
jgi:hypothetical protein